MRHPRVYFILAVVAALAVLVAAPAGASPRADLQVRHMRINYLQYHPNLAHVLPGQEIDITNIDGQQRDIPHTVTAKNGAFDTDVFFDTAVIFAPTTPGRYPFYCEIHPFMHGTLVVEGG
jgi:plastocyanin